MAKLLVLYYSTYGHIETMAQAEVEGARSVSGTEVTLKQVHELMPEETLKAIGAKVNRDIPIAEPRELADYDGVIFGTPTRFGNMCAQMRNFMDQTGKLWISGALVGKVGSVFTSTGTQHGGQETTITSFHTTLFHQGFIVVGVPYTCKGLSNMDEISGGSPYGASTLAGSDGRSRSVSKNELAIARFQGEHVASITKKLFG